MFGVGEHFRCYLQDAVYIHLFTCFVLFDIIKRQYAYMKQTGSMYGKNFKGTKKQNANHHYVHFEHHHNGMIIIQFWTMFLLLGTILKDIWLPLWAIMSLKVGVVWVIWDILHGIVSFFVGFLIVNHRIQKVCHTSKIFLCLSWCVFFGQLYL